MDWDRVRAEDLFLALSSFCPPGGRLLKVSIYPSEFGKKRIAEEEALGPEELRGSKNNVVVDERCCTVSRILFSKKFTSLHLDTLIIPVIILKIGSLHDLSLTERQIMKKTVWPSQWLLRCLIEP